MKAGKAMKEERNRIWVKNQKYAIMMMMMSLLVNSMKRFIRSFATQLCDDELMKKLVEVLHDNSSLEDFNTVGRWYHRSHEHGILTLP